MKILKTVAALSFVVAVLLTAGLITFSVPLILISVAVLVVFAVPLVVVVSFYEEFKRLMRCTWTEDELETLRELDKDFAIGNIKNKE